MENNTTEEFKAKNKEIAENEEQKEIKNEVDNESDSNETEDEISFEDLGLDERTLAAIEKKGFKIPSPIQALAIPRLLNGESNMIARARTGTGKTAAFGLPIIQNLRDEMGTVKALILEPTRELAIQTCTEMQSFTEGKTPRTCVLYGGASYATQIRDLKRGVEIVVGTPGRVQDHIERKTLDLSKIEYFILDEGDEMLDMGFIEDIENIFKNANPNARILLFSATMPAPILEIASKFLGDYEIVEEQNVIDEPLLIDQKFWILKESEKIDALVRLIDIADDFYGIVFTQTKSDADFVNKILDEKGYEVAALHGDIVQSQREKIIARFRNKKTRILVATDVAARGIDITGLSHVVNYSLPFDGATYVHRIGRTGRAGSAGTAVTFVTMSESRKLRFLQRAIKKASKGEMIQEQIPTTEEVIEKKKTRIFGELSKKIDNEQANEEFVKMATELCQENDSKDVLAAVLSVMYASKLDKERYGKIQNRTINVAGNSNPNQTRIYVQLGKIDGYNARALADWFSRLLHIPGRDVDQIDISQTFSLVSLPKQAAKKALDMANSNAKIPHMHIDTKSSDFSFEDERHSRRKRGGRGGQGRREHNRFENDRERDRSRKNEKNSKGARNFHNQVERNSASAYKKSNKKAERF